ncbi:MAG: hypothetical protein QOI12_520 [Alphaproteobacteria bacterium]|jgi:hypothetical protein|nr:hypothetical protein [Alphaproteobacteria bacterium]
MLGNSSIGAVTLAAALCITAAAAHAQDGMKFPDWKGQWVRIGAGGQYDPTKPPMRGQEPPLTPEYQAIWEANIAEATSGGQNYNPQVHCMPGGMPRMMMAYEPMEVIVLPETTYVHITFNSEFRRIFTDGRDWPKNEEPSFAGYSIGRWIDEDGDGRYDVLEIETRNLKGPRIFDPTGIPLHKDNQTVVKERIYLDKADPNILRNQMTTFDNALTRPWTVTRGYRRLRNAPWTEHSCGENNEYVFIEGQTYTIEIDGKLGPSRKDQPPPDLRHFKQTQN